MSDSRARGRDVLLFLAIAFGWSWAFGLVLWRTGLMRPENAGPLTLALMFAFMCGPAIAALVCAAVFDTGRRLAALGLRPRLNVWLVWAWLTPVLITAGALGLTLALSDRGYAPLADTIVRALAAKGQDASALPLTPEQLAWVQLASAATLGPLINWPLLLTEELGWRGWLWDRWAGMGFWRNVAATGVVWGVWHAPLIALGYNYPGMPVAGPLLMIAFTTLVCPALHLIRARGGSVWHAALFHGTLNALGGLTLAMLDDASMPWAGVVGLGGFLALALASAAAALYVQARPAAS